MVFGARSFGVRGFGDNTGDAGAGSGAPVTNGQAVLAGTATLSATAAAPTNGAAVLAGFATISPTGTVLINGRALLAGRGRFVASAPFLQSWDPAKQSAQYRLRIVDLSGDGYTEFDKAVISDVVWELNGIGSCKFTVPVLDPKATHIKIPEREVQVWRGNQLLWWGVMVRATANNATLEIQCVGLKWYLTRRFFGKVDRTNYLYDPSFEGDTTPPPVVAGSSGVWNMGWRSPIEPYSGRNPAHWLIEYRTDKVVTGSRSLYMEQVSSTQPKYGISASQSFAYEIDASVDPQGTEWTFAVWVYIVGAKWRGVHSGGGIDDGLTIARYSTTETILIGVEGSSDPPIPFPAPIESVSTPIDENTPQDTWIRLECTLRQPFKAGEPEFIQVSINCPNGAMYADAATFTLSEKTAFYDQDQATIISGVLDHAQDVDYYKSPLNIEKNVPLTGVLRTREYWHSEHQVISDALDEFHTLHEGVDTDIVITPTRRIYTSYFPRKGIERPHLVLELGRNIETFTVNYDGTETSNSIVVLGDGAGSDREEGGAMDANALTDGLILERVFNAIPGSHIKTLDDQAYRGLQRLKSPVIIPSITTYEGSTRLIGVLQTGDVVPVRISHGFVQVNAKYRIISISLDPRTERLTYSINPAETSFV